MDKDEGDADFLITDKSTDKPDEQLKKKKKKLVFIIQLVLGTTVKRPIADLIRSSRPAEFMYT